MAYDPEKFPENSILRHNQVDVFADGITGEVVLICEGAFEKELVGLELYANYRELMFIFEGDEGVTYGAPLDNDVAFLMLKAHKAGVFNFSSDLEPLGAKIVPIDVIFD